MASKKRSTNFARIPNEPNIANVPKTYIKFEGKPSKRGRDYIGDPTWDVLHTFGAAYTPDKYLDAVAFVKSLGALFPCAHCRENFKKKLVKYPIENYLKNNHDFFFWTYLVHDDVNKSYNEHHPDKPQKYSPPFDKVKDWYWQVVSDECKECESHLKV